MSGTAKKKIKRIQEKVEEFKKTREKNGEILFLC